MQRMRLALARTAIHALRAARKLGARGVAPPVLSSATRSIEARVAHHLVSILRPDERAAINRWLYDARPSYLPGSSFFAQGLVDWEREALATAPFPTAPCRWLVGGAGGGREVAALRQRGHDVYAFEPAHRLFDGLAAVAAPGHAACGAFADLDRPHGPLAGILAAQPFAAVLLGSSALSHVTTPREQHALFAALPRLAPGAPILSSQFSAEGDGGTRPGVRFTVEHGFFYVFAEAELQALAAAHGYAILRHPGWPPESTIWVSSRRDP